MTEREIGMTTTRVFVFLFIWIALGLTACRQPSIREVLTEATSLVDQNPDSAVLLLEEHIMPVSLTNRDKADYWYLLTAAHLMQGRSLVNDSLINYSVAYYRRHGNGHRLFNACRFAAWQSKWGDRDKQRQERLWIEAVSVAEAENDTAYLSDAYRHLSNFYSDEKQYQKAIDICRKKETLSQKDRATAWYIAGLNYERMNQSDSCHKYMSAAAKLAYEIESEDAFHYMRNYADVLSAEAPKEALALLDHTRSSFPGKPLPLSYAIVYKELGLMDSARYYLAKAKTDQQKEELSEAGWMLESLQQLLREATTTAQTDPNNQPLQPDNTFFRKVLLQQLGFIRLVATSPTQQNKELLQQMARIANDDVPSETLLIWSDLYPIIDAAFDNFYTRLTALADGRLTEKETQLCCLLRAGFSTKEISVVTQQSVRTIYQRKTNIRHALGMDKKDDIVGHINHPPT